MAVCDPLSPAVPRRELNGAARQGMATTAVPQRDLARLIGYDFSRHELLNEALTHPSALRPLQQGRRRARRGALPRNYERLEFLGDRVLGLVVADLLWHRFER